LSNNDGCVVALSQEANKIGIIRAMPIFEVKNIARNHDVAIFSSNYALYGDISHRAMNLLGIFSPDIEIYSIDEAFLDLSEFRHLDIASYAAKIKTAVFRSTGIPVSIGIGSTKTLAKLANKIGKNRKCCGGIFNITGHQDMEKILSFLPVSEVCGVGRQYVKMLASYGIRTVLDLTKADDTWIRRHMTVNGLYTVWELRGRSCMELEKTVPAKKNIVSSRIFGTPVTSRRHLKEAVAFYATIACEKLRKQGSLCGLVRVFIATNRFKPELLQYSNSVSLELPVPTCYTNDIIDVAQRGIDMIYRTGYEYKRAGVMLDGIISKNDIQYDLFAGYAARKDDLTRTIDGINRNFGKCSVTSASFGFRKVWGMRRTMKSPDYTTRWDDLAVVKA
jgi:DNA polymerase V